MISAGIAADGSGVRIDSTLGTATPFDRKGKPSGSARAWTADEQTQSQTAIDEFAAGVASAQDVARDAKAQIVLDDALHRLLASTNPEVADLAKALAAVSVMASDIDATAEAKAAVEGKP